MFDSLGLKLQDTIQNLRGQKKITEENIDSTLTDIRRRLLESDVSLKAVKLFTSRVKEEALGKDVITGINPGEQLVQIIHSALVEILGGKIINETKLNIVEHLSLSEDSCSILLLGLQGAGKTTTSAKLAYKLKQAGKNPLLVPCDLQRPAAVKQLKILAKQAEVDFLDITQEGSDLYTVSSVLELVKLAQQESDKNKNKVLIFDTAGRLQVDTNLMAELLLLEKQVKPTEKLLVLDSLIGQEAANVAETFNTQIGITGSILTKMDSDTRGGAALSVVEATNKPIKLAAVGEKLDDLEIFYPDRIASRILGMGDVLSLVEKAQERIDEIESKRLEAELLKGNFNYETFMTFQNMMSKLGDFTSIFKMMGMGNLLSQMGLTGINHNDVLEQGQSKMQKFRIAINSMTKEERKNPDLLSTAASAKSRRARITRGSGLRDTDISQLSSEFIKMSKTFKTIGPMLNMMGNTDALEQKINPQDMINHMLGGLSKKQRQAAKHAGMLPNKLVKPEKKIKKGEKPSVKGFRN
jgi:signal recognition particle subunit SRP54